MPISPANSSAQETPASLETLGIADIVNPSPGLPLRGPCIPTDDVTSVALTREKCNGEITSHIQTLVFHKNLKKSG